MSTDEGMFEEQSERLARRLAAGEPLRAADRAWIEKLSDEQGVELAERLADDWSERPIPVAVAQTLDLLRYPAQRRLLEHGRAMAPDQAGRLLSLVETGDAMWRCQILAWVAAAGDAAALRHWVPRLLAMSPSSPAAAARCLEPLFHRTDGGVATVFPALLEGLQQPVLAPAILDLANVLTQASRVAEHPASSRGPQLAELLGMVVGRLQPLEQSALRGEALAPADAEAIREGAALAQALCAALGLIGNPTARSALHLALELGHRPVRMEAAAALARLGDETGLEGLPAMAAQPLTRRRALQAAAELELLDKIPAEYQSESALLEADFVSALALPTCFGVAPTRCELLDQRRLPWPGADEPVTVTLFRYLYRTADAEYTNIGIAGPLFHALRHDLTALPLDDVYAAYAGWHAQHDEIRTWPITEIGPLEQPVVTERLERLEREGCRAVRVELLGSFFGERVLAGTAVRGGQPGAFAADATETLWFDQQGSRSPLQGPDAWWIYQGRRMLRSFRSSPPPDGDRSPKAS